jgi:hypothetical protein
LRAVVGVGGPRQPVEAPEAAELAEGSVLLELAEVVALVSPRPELEW